KSEQYFYLYFPSIVAFFVAIISLGANLCITHVILVDPRQYFLLGIGFVDHAAGSSVNPLQFAKALTVIVGIFFLVTATFAALTSKLGELLNRGSPLAGYSTNVAGSLFGIVSFSVVSYFVWPLLAWLIVVYVSLLYLYLYELIFKLAM